MVPDEPFEVREKRHAAARRLLRSRRDLNPRLRARGSGRIVRSGAGTVVPVRLRRSVPHDDRRRLYHDLRWEIVGRVVICRVILPPRAAPAGSDDDDAVAMKVAVESVVPVETVAAAMATASMARCIAWRGRNEEERKG